ncbi:MAG: Rieske (2Fe-2S) protein [Candidatus Tectomicrobia bacterium RIFCSPLOWO2_12_FULL_69_37]|nr:MAG: Rieske (2Fe-2S) protein [Candidatus Tectomicrobia bacterium RIFCSPLOWO2_12_FULL_69_37]OGL64495.1 MAG: Rieske (2Fe-2S) protein [Candidatus Tectomicrobia bacterium RIFCSPLOWO2_02_FULL_70_19]
MSPTRLKAPNVKLPAEYEAETQRQPQGMDRRRFLNYTGWLGILGSLAVSLLGFLRFLFPRVLFEPPTQFKAGLPADYAVGAVDTRFVASQRVWIIREENGFYALSAICTHLGCTPAWLATENKFKCPCHGSGFRRTGVNFEGPAPRPLERVRIALADDGQLLIDKGKSFRQEKGEWSSSDAFLNI